MQQQYAVLVPVKPPARGKSRLRGLEDDQRRGLATAFALDTAAACLAAARVGRVLVATDDADFAARLAALGCTTVPDGDSRGLNPVLRQAAAEARRRWPTLAPVALCADLPALVAVELDEALAALDALSVGTEGAPAYVADAGGSGTTLYAATHDRFDPRFGPDSARAHAQAGARPLTGALATLRHDVDDLEDLERARRLGLGPHTSTAVADLWPDD